MAGDSWRKYDQAQAGIMSHIEEARASQDAHAYYQLCVSAGLAGEEVDDLSLFERGEADHHHTCSGDISLETALSPGFPEKKTVAEIKISVPRVWGIRERADLMCFDLGTLTRMLAGQNNLDIPPEMLYALQPAEILAKYVGAGILKANDSHRYFLTRKGLSDSEIDSIPVGRVVKEYLEIKRQGGSGEDLKENFLILYKFIDGCVYKSPNFRARALMLDSFDHLKAMRQQRRLEAISDAAKRGFAESFFAQYNDRFYNPNVDGASKQLAAQEVYRQLKVIWDRTEEYRKRITG